MEKSDSRGQIVSQPTQGNLTTPNEHQSTDTAKSYSNLALPENFQKYTAIVNDFENICKLCRHINDESTEADYMYILAVVNNLIDMCVSYKREHGYVLPGVVAQRYEKVENIRTKAVKLHDDLIEKGMKLLPLPVTNNQSVTPENETLSSSVQQSSDTQNKSPNSQEPIINTQINQTSLGETTVSTLDPPKPSIQPLPLAMSQPNPFVVQPSIQTSEPKLLREEKRQNARKNLIPVCEEEGKKYHISADATVSLSDAWKKDLMDSQYRIVDTFATSGLKKAFGILCDELSENCMGRTETYMDSCITDRDINKKLPPAPMLIPEITASIETLRYYEDYGYNYYDKQNDEDKEIPAEDICDIIAFLEKWKEVLTAVQNYFETAVKSLDPQLKIFADFIDTGAAKDFLLKEGPELITVPECAQLLKKLHIVEAMTLANDEVVNIDSNNCELLKKCKNFFSAIIRFEDHGLWYDYQISSLRALYKR